MIKLDLTQLAGFVSADAVADARKLAEKSFEEVKTKTGKGPEWLGWKDILADPNDALLGQIDDLAHEIRTNADIFISCGIGGSYLGAKAVIDALAPTSVDSGIEVVYAGHHMGGAYLERLIQNLSQPKADGTPKSVYLNVISKSGTTIETALSFRVIRNWMESTYGKEETAKRIVCTTSAEGGALNKVISANGYRKFVLPNDVGGRFSVLTPVGLLPIAVAGVDIRALFYGAVGAAKAFEETPDMVLDYAANRYVLGQTGTEVDLIATFEPELVSFGGWFQQLFGESEGKNGKGIYPAVLGYSTDLHSLGQMVQQGKRNVMETFLTVARSTSGLSVPEDADNHDGLNYLSGKTFHEINQKAFPGTLEAHLEGGVPCLTLELPGLDAASIGETIYFFELACAVYVYCLGENPFDQPGVEDYKKAMYRLLGRPS